MKKKYFTVGPSQLYPTVQQHIADALRDDILSISHRSKQFIEIYKYSTDNLRKLMGIPQDYYVFFLSSATEAMEKIIQNTVEKNSLHLVNGAFSKKFFKIAEQLGKDPEKIEVSHGEGFEFKSINIPAGTECVCITQNETSTGVSLEFDDIYSIKQKNRNIITAIDVVSSAPFITIDFGKVDMVFFSVQKGFGLPAGLGILIVSPQAFDKAKNLFEKGNSIGSYHNFLIMEEYARKFQTHDTPNVFDIYLLGRVCNDINNRGIGVIRKETEEKARLIYEFFEKHPKYTPFVKDKKNRSQTTIVIETQGDTNRMLPYLASKGFIINSGYGVYRENQIRIANFPSSNLEDVERFRNELERFF